MRVIKKTARNHMSALAAEVINIERGENIVDQDGNVVEPTARPLMSDEYAEYGIITVQGYIQVIGDVDLSKFIHDLEKRLRKIDCTIDSKKSIVAYTPNTLTTAPAAASHRKFYVYCEGSETKGKFNWLVSRTATDKFSIPTTEQVASYCTIIYDAGDYLSASHMETVEDLDARRFRGIDDRFCTARLKCDWADISIYHVPALYRAYEGTAEDFGINRYICEGCERPVSGYAYVLSNKLGTGLLYCRSACLPSDSKRWHLFTIPPSDESWSYIEVPEGCEDVIAEARKKTIACDAVVHGHTINAVLLGDKYIGMRHPNVYYTSYMAHDKKCIYYGRTPVEIIY